MKALIDGDILVYWLGFGYATAPDYIVRRGVDMEIRKVLANTGTNDYRVYLDPADRSNYRYDIYPEYKAKRNPKPIHYDLIRAHLINQHGAELTYGQEADDALGIAGTAEGGIICTIDKDLRQVPGEHYNLRTGRCESISIGQGASSFFLQLLIGDKTDNIPSLQTGIGPVGANRILCDETRGENEWTRIRNVYSQVENNLAEQTLARNGQLLWIRREEGQLWTPDYHQRGWSSLATSTPSIE